MGNVTTADIVIIGSGVVGASTALALSKAGHRVHVVDKAGGPGQGTTSASSACVRFNYSGIDSVLSAWEAKFRWEEWEDYLGFNDPAGMARFQKVGVILLETKLLSHERQAELFNQAGIGFEYWTAADLAANLPGVDVGRYYPPKPVDSEEFWAEPEGQLSAVYTPEGGYVDDAMLAAANLAHAAEQRGATFSFHRQVTAIGRAGAAWTVSLDNGDEVQAQAVVNAAGPWSTQINTLVGVGADFTVAPAPMRQEVHHVPVPTDFEGRPDPVIFDLDLGTYFRGHMRNSWMIGGAEPECDPLEWIDDPDAATPRVTADRFEAQVLRTARRIPSLKVPNRRAGVVGVYDVTPDWTPIWDKTDADGFYVGIGTSGNCFKMAPVIGDLMTSVIEGVAAGVDHDATPVTWTAPHIGQDINLGAFSRLRDPSTSSGTVMG